jgi:hypothetical protein
MSGTVEEERVKKEKLQLEDDAVPVGYELVTKPVGKKRETTGRLILNQALGPTLSKALADMSGANLLAEDGQVLWVEFTNNLNGKEIEFIASPSRGHALTSDRNL